MSTVYHTGIFIVSLIMSLALVPLASRIAVRVGGLDIPDERKVHQARIPRLGGIAIFFACIPAILIFAPLDREMVGILVGGILIFLVGLADDLYDISARLKLTGQFVAVLTAVILSGKHFTGIGNLFDTGDINTGSFGVPFTVFAIIGIINAINLIDGLDGLAGGISVIASASFAILGFITGNQKLIVMSIALCGAVIGFLRHNVHPAKIFMGDSGSLFLGYCMGMFSLCLLENNGGEVSNAVPLLILAVPVIDTIVVATGRAIRSEKIFVADRTHIHHRLLDLGISHATVVMIICGITSILGCIAVCCLSVPEYLVIVFVAVSSSIFYVLVCFNEQAQSESMFKYATAFCRALFFIVPGIFQRLL